MNNIKDIDWIEVERLCDNIVKNIHESNFKADMILAISRGGLVPARLLSTRLNIEWIECIPFNKFKYVESYLLKDVINNCKNILLVDDIYDTGKTIDYIFDVCLENIRNKYNIIVKTATLHTKNQYKVSFYGDVAGPEWIVYPWEMANRT